MKENAAIRCEDVRFSYEEGMPEVLRNLSIEIPAGSYAVIAGPSGAGKSTFARILNNIIPLFYRGPFSGTRWIAGEYLENQSIASVAARVGMVFQDFEQQLFSTSSRLELAFAMENFNISIAEMQQRMDVLTSRFGIAHLLDREPLSLSGGEKQKLAIATVMAYRPQILVLDEPTTDLDPQSREFVLQVIPQLKDWVETVIVIDHESDQFQEADFIYLLRDGLIQISGPPADLLTRSQVLIENSLAPLDLVLLQERLGYIPKLMTAGQLQQTLADRSLAPVAPVPRPAAPPVVEMAQLNFQYKDQTQPALEQIELEIRQGEFIGIIGNNGSGKSTLIRHLNGLQFPQSGRVRVLGKEVREWNRKELSRKVGLVFQNPDHQIFESTVQAEIEFGPRQFGFTEAEIRKNAERAIEVMDLSQLVERDPFQLSKGERQRVAVASVLSVNPDILILDEPTTGLDHRQQRYLMNLLHEFNQTGTTVIIVTHALKLVGDYCSYAVVLSQGKKIAEGHPGELFFSDVPFKLPPLYELSKRKGGNALSVDNFIKNLKS
jgi:energy-coupling factor transport system ATP-binding protein